MLKEQLLGFAMKALSGVHETKERIKNNLKKETVQNYVKGIKEIASWMVENQLSKMGQPVRPKKAQKSSKRSVKTEIKKSQKPRKSSIKPVKELSSPMADKILEMLKVDSCRLVGASDEIEGKKSLAYLLWALGHAERANIAQGISVHDVSALLYRACQIELYPINISRVVYQTPLVEQVNKEGRTKTYLLSSKGQELFKNRFL